jgi:hypothetical protein
MTPYQLVDGGMKKFKFEDAHVSQYYLFYWIWSN